MIDVYIDGSSKATPAQAEQGWLSKMMMDKPSPCTGFL